MENYENEELHQEQEYTKTEPQRQANQTGWNQTSKPYNGAGVGRKESPFADSPYVMNHAQQEQRSYQYHSSHVPPVPPVEPPVNQPKAKKEKGGKLWKSIVAGVLTVALVAGGCGITAMVVNDQWEDRTEQMAQDLNERINVLEQQIAADSQQIHSGTSVTILDPSTVTAPGAVYAQNVKSVVLINSTVTSTMYGQTATGVSSGSGFILTEDGYVVTNHHVVEDASSISVTMSDGSEYPAELVGSDKTNDVAVLKMEGSGFPAVTIGSSDALNVGDQVVAIGNPLGELTSTLTVGYVSAKERDVTTDGTTINMLQTDAAINSGNSGGPLFNMNGEVVGITTAKYSGSSSSGATIEGIGFAIPIDDAMPLVEDLMNYGYVTGAYLGVMVSDMDAQTASYYGLPVGAYIQEVTSGYCAEAAGLQAKDIIVALGEHKIENVSDLTRSLREFNAGDITTVTVYRGGGEVVLDITLDEKPQTTETETEILPGEEMPQDGNFEEWYNFFSPFFGNG